MSSKHFEVKPSFVAVVTVTWWKTVTFCVPPSVRRTPVMCFLPVQCSLLMRKWNFYFLFVNIRRTCVIHSADVSKYSTYGYNY